MNTLHPKVRGTLPEDLSWAVAVLMLLQSAGGLLFPELYRDVEWIRAAWFGNDLVTLVVGGPLLIAGLALSRRGSVRGELAARCLGGLSRRPNQLFYADYSDADLERLAD